MVLEEEEEEEEELAAQEFRAQIPDSAVLGVALHHLALGSGAEPAPQVTDLVLDGSLPKTGAERDTAKGP